MKTTTWICIVDLLIVVAAAAIGVVAGEAFRLLASGNLGL